MAADTAAGPRSCSAKSLLITHPRLSKGTSGRERSERGRAVSHPHRGCRAACGADVTGPPSPALPAPGPQAYATVTVKPSSPARLLKVGAVVLISGAVLLLFGAIGAFYFWKGSDNHVSPEGGARGADPSLGAQGGEVRGAERRAGRRGPHCHPHVPL